MVTSLQGENGNLPVIGILIACPVELVDIYISVISKHSPHCPGTPIHHTNVKR